MTRVYFASKAKLAPMWRELEAVLPDGITNTTSWIKHEHPAPQIAAIQQAATREASRADYVIAVLGPGDQHKGALVEIGACLGTGNTVIVCGPRPAGHNWMEHPQVVFAQDTTRAIEIIQQSHNPRRSP
jgi:hypothetical protein